MFPKTVLLAAAAALLAGNIMGGVIVAERESAVDSVDADVAIYTAQFEAPVLRVATNSGAFFLFMPRIPISE